MRQKTAIVNQHKWKKLLDKAKETGDKHKYNMVYMLFWSGMHISVYIDPVGHYANFDGDILSWSRPKTGKRVVHRISITCSNPKLYQKHIQWWLKNNWNRKTAMTYNRWLKQIGKKAGVPDVSSLTLRHTYCYRRLIETKDIMRVKMEMQCTMDVLSQNYMLIHPDQFS